MDTNFFISKKRRIILVLGAALLFLLATSHYIKTQNLTKQTALGGHVGLVMKEVPLPRQEFDFLRFHSSRMSMVNDLQTPIALPRGVFSVKAHIVDDAYPLLGALTLDRKNFKIIFNSTPQTRTYGVAVNKVFLDTTGLKFGDFFRLEKNTYQIRGLIHSLPDTSGQSQLSEPMLMMRHYAMPGSGLFVKATSKEFQYRILSKALSAKEIEERFRQKFPRSPAQFIRWDAQP